MEFDCKHVRSNYLSPIPMLEGGTVIQALGNTETEIMTKRSLESGLCASCCASPCRDLKEQLKSDLSFI